MSGVYYNLHVFNPVSRLVGWFVSKITQKQLTVFPRNLVDGSGKNRLHFCVDLDQGSDPGYMFYLLLGRFSTFSPRNNSWWKHNQAHLGNCSLWNSVQPDWRVCCLLFSWLVRLKSGGTHGGTWSKKDKDKDKYIYIFFKLSYLEGWYVWLCADPNKNPDVADLKVFFNSLCTETNVTVISTVTPQHSVQGVPRLLPNVSWDWLQPQCHPQRINGIDNGWMT